MNLISLNIHAIKHHLARDLKIEKNTNMETLYIDRNPQQRFFLNKITVKDLVGSFYFFLSYFRINSKHL
jgi:hypothetical protein